jgi:hypothetical protein
MRASRRSLSLCSLLHSMAKVMLLYTFITFQYQYCRSISTSIYGVFRLSAHHGILGVCDYMADSMVSYALVVTLEMPLYLVCFWLHGPAITVVVASSCHGIVYLRYVWLWLHGHAVVSFNCDGFLII